MLMISEAPQMLELTNDEIKPKSETKKPSQIKSTKNILTMESVPNEFVTPAKFLKEIPLLNEAKWRLKKLIGSGTYSKVMECTRVCTIDHDSNSKGEGIFNKKETFAFKDPYPELRNNHSDYHDLKLYQKLSTRMLVPRLIDFGLNKICKLCMITEKYDSDGAAYLKKIKNTNRYPILGKIYFDNVLFLINKMSELGMCNFDMKNQNVVVNYDKQYRLTDMRLIDIDTNFIHIEHSDEDGEILGKKKQHLLSTITCIIWYTYSLYDSFSIRNLDLFQELFKNIDNDIEDILDCYHLETNYTYPNLRSKCPIYRIHKKTKCLCGYWTFSCIICYITRRAVGGRQRARITKELYFGAIDEIITSLKSVKDANSLRDEILRHL